MVYETMLIESIMTTFAITIISIAAAWFIFMGSRTTHEKRANGRTSLTYAYRKFLTNLIVIGKVREYAKKHGINLKEEEKEFKKHQEIWERLSKEPKSKELDDTIEEEMTEEIEKQNNKK